MNKALADSAAKSQNGSQDVAGLTDLLSKVPGTSSLRKEAVDLQSAAADQAMRNQRESTSGDSQYRQTAQSSYNAGGLAAAANLSSPAANFDLQATIAKVYPILEFRDKVVKTLAKIVSTIPGLEKVIETISEKVTLFIMGLLAPYVQPIIEMASQQLKVGSSAVINASGQHQYGPWEDMYCTDPTHSLLSKDHFSNVLNEPSGQVASAILQYVAPRVIYGWDHPEVPVEQILGDVVRVFHHPAVREHIEIHQSMFKVVETWAKALPDGGASMNRMLSSDGVRNGGNHKGGDSHGHKPAGISNIPGLSDFNSFNMHSMAREVDEVGFDNAHSRAGNTTLDTVNNDRYDAEQNPTAYQQGYEMPVSNSYAQPQAEYPKYGYEQPPYSSHNQGSYYNNEPDSDSWRRS